MYKELLAGLSGICLESASRVPDFPFLPRRKKSISHGVQGKAGRLTVINENIDNLARQLSEKSTRKEGAKERPALSHHYYGFTAHLVVSSGGFGVRSIWGLSLKLARLLLGASQQRPHQETTLDPRAGDSITCKIENLNGALHLRLSSNK